MINPRELRIGNQLKWKDNGQDMEVILPLLGDVNFWKHIEHGDIEAIPLTEEWLIKFRFKQDRIYKYRWSIGTFILHLTFSLEKPHKEYYALALDYGQFLTTPVLSVHKLQNLFFALTETELEGNI